MAMRREDTRREHNSFVESMLKKAEEKNTIKPQSLYDSVDVKKIQELTAEIKSGSTAHRTKRQDF